MLCGYCSNRIDAEQGRFKQAQSGHQVREAPRELESDLAAGTSSDDDRRSCPQRLEQCDGIVDVVDEVDLLERFRAFTAGEAAAVVDDAAAVFRELLGRVHPQQAELGVPWIPRIGVPSPCSS